jgi:hypothetical protein
MLLPPLLLPPLLSELMLLPPLRGNRAVCSAIFYASASSELVSSTEGMDGCR